MKKKKPKYLREFDERTRPRFPGIKNPVEIVDRVKKSDIAVLNTRLQKGPLAENRREYIEGLQATAKEHVGSSLPANGSGPNSRMNTEKGSDGAR